jgi:hypothetical protein
MIIIYPQTQVLFDFRFALDNFYYSNSKETVLTLDSHLNNVFVETSLILFLLACSTLGKKYYSRATLKQNK